MRRRVLNVVSYCVGNGDLERTMDVCLCVSYAGRGVFSGLSNYKVFYWLLLFFWYTSTVYVPCRLPFTIILNPFLPFPPPFTKKKLESNLKQFADCAAAGDVSAEDDKGDGRDNVFYFVATDEAATQALASKVQTSLFFKVQAVYSFMGSFVAHFNPNIWSIYGLYIVVRVRYIDV